MNPFEFYGLQPNLLIDEAKLRAQYLKVQREWHPDYFAADPEKQLQAAEKTAQNNRYYQKLNSFSARMQTILDMHNLAGDAGNILPGSFLMEMMELNEEIEVAASNSQLRKAVESQIQQKEDSVLQQAMELANKWGENIAQVEPLAKLQQLYQMNRYLLRLKNKIQSAY